jgi:putative FmdB family regulatory protein
LPTYDYQCRSCGVITEVVHSMLEDGPTTCQHCGGDLRRVVHAAGIIFKGSGFYKTDSRSSSSASVPGGTRPKPAEPKADAPSGGTAEAKSPPGGGAGPKVEGG